MKRLSKTSSGSRKISVAKPGGNSSCKPPLSKEDNVTPKDCKDSNSPVTLVKDKTYVKEKTKEKTASAVSSSATNLKRYLHSSSQHVTRSDSKAFDNPLSRKAKTPVGESSKSASVVGKLRTDLGKHQPKRAQPIVAKPVVPLGRNPQRGDLKLTKFSESAIKLTRQSISSESKSSPTSTLKGSPTVGTKPKVSPALRKKLRDSPSAAISSVPTTKSKFIASKPMKSKESIPTVSPASTASVTGRVLIPQSKSAEIKRTVKSTRSRLPRSSLTSESEISSSLKPKFAGKETATAIPKVKPIEKFGGNTKYSNTECHKIRENKKPLKNRSSNDGKILSRQKSEINEKSEEYGTPKESTPLEETSKKYAFRLEGELTVKKCSESGNIKPMQKSSTTPKEKDVDPSNLPKLEEAANVFDDGYTKDDDVGARSTALPDDSLKEVSAKGLKTLDATDGNVSSKFEVLVNETFEDSPSSLDGKDESLLNEETLIYEKSFSDGCLNSDSDVRESFNVSPNNSTSVMTEDPKNNESIQSEENLPQVETYDNFLNTTFDADNSLKMENIPGNDPTNTAGICQKDCSNKEQNLAESVDDDYEVCANISVTESDGELRVTSISNEGASKKLRERVQKILEKGKLERGILEKCNDDSKDETKDSNNYKQDKVETTTPDERVIEGCPSNDRERNEENLSTEKQSDEDKALSSGEYNEKDKEHSCKERGNESEGQSSDEQSNLSKGLSSGKINKENEEQSSDVPGDVRGPHSPDERSVEGGSISSYEQGNEVEGRSCSGHTSEDADLSQGGKAGNQSFGLYDEAKQQSKFNERIERVRNLAKEITDLTVHCEKYKRNEDRDDSEIRIPKTPMESLDMDAFLQEKSDPNKGETLHSGDFEELTDLKEVSSENLTGDLLKSKEKITQTPVAESICKSKPEKFLLLLESSNLIPKGNEQNSSLSNADDSEAKIIEQLVGSSLNSSSASEYREENNSSLIGGSFLSSSSASEFREENNSSVIAGESKEISVHKKTWKRKPPYISIELLSNVIDSKNVRRRGLRKFFSMKFFRYEYMRYLTFLYRPNIAPSASLLARCGFVYTRENKNDMYCVFCTIYFLSFNKRNNPDTIHKGLNPSCPFYSELMFDVPLNVYSYSLSNCGNPLLKELNTFLEDYMVFRLIHTDPKPPTTSSLIDSLGPCLDIEWDDITEDVLMDANFRYDTFENQRLFKMYENEDTFKLPLTLHMAEAGFISTGVGDLVVCVFCGGGIFNWSHDDNPIEEHARFYPNCEYIQTKLSPERIQTLTREAKCLKEDFKARNIKLSYDESTLLLEHDLSKFLIDAGVNETILKHALTLHIEEEILFPANTYEISHVLVDYVVRIKSKDNPAHRITSQIF